jgi:tripartite ATP-independent transporter DctP family solute receptor
MKKLVVLLLLVCLVLSFSSVYGASPVIQMKFGHFAAEGHEGNLASKMFAEAVEKRTNGQIKVTIFPNNSLGAPPEVLEQNILGAIDMSCPTQGQLGVYSKKFFCVMLPFAYTNYEHADRVLNSKKFIKWVTPDLDKAGLVLLSNWEWGFRNLTTSSKPVRNPEDAKGLKIRTPPELSTQAAIEALGATVATINFNELQMALKQGVVDGQENPIGVIYSNKLYETQKFITMTGHNYNSMVHVISKKVWKKLTPAQRNIIKQESQKAGAWMKNACRSAEANQIKEMKEKYGVEVINPDVAKFKALMKPAYDRMSAQAGADNIAYFLKLVDENK